MTRADHVRELRRQIKGIAMNYPDGLDPLVDELAIAWMEKRKPTRILFGEGEPTTNEDGMNTYAVLQDLVKRVEALETRYGRRHTWQKVTVTEAVAGAVSGAGTETETGVGETSAAPKEQDSQGEKRKPGRPRKQQ